MDQRPIDYERRDRQRSALQSLLQGKGMTGAALAICALIEETGDVITFAGQRYSHLAIDCRSLGELIGKSKSQADRTVQSLEKMGALLVDRTRRPHGLYLSWQDVGRLPDRAPDDPASALASLVENRESCPPLSPACPAPMDPSTSKNNLHTIHPNHSIPASAGPRRSSGGGRPKRWLCLTDEQVRGLDIDDLRRAYRQVVGWGWLRLEDEDRLKFLAVCYHAAKHPDVARPAALVAARLDPSRPWSWELLMDEAWEWAKRTLRQWESERAEGGDRMAESQKGARL